MTDEGVEAVQKIAITQDPVTVEKYLKKTVNYITVTDCSLCLIQYTNLTMAAHNSDKSTPDQNCAQIKIDLENGRNSVTSYLFKDDVDNEILINEEYNLLLAFQPYTDSYYSNQQICWSTFK